MKESGDSFLWWGNKSGGKTYDRMEKIFEILGMKLSRLKFIPNLD